MQRRLGLGLVSAALAALAIVNAYIKNGQFYPMCIHLYNSNASFLVFSVLVVYIVFLVGTLIQRIFFGELRVMEIENVHENLLYTLSEIFLTLTIFKDEFNIKLVLCFSTVILSKIFQWILKDRVHYMERTISLSLTFHMRLVSMMVFLMMANTVFFVKTMKSTLKMEPSIMVLLSFETSILLINLLTIAYNYMLNVIDSTSPEIWDSKSSFIFYFDLLANLMKICVYTYFFIVIANLYGLPLHMLRDVLITFKSFVKRIRDWYRYRQATKNMEERYPSATQEELEFAGNICIICREDMTEARKLFCGHAFHFRCLRSWLERQQTCPVCRRSLLDSPVVDQTQQTTPFPDFQNDSPGTRRSDEHVDRNNMSSDPALQQLRVRNDAPIVFIETDNNLNLKDIVPLKQDLSEISIKDLSDRELLEMEGSLREKIIARIRFLEKMQDDVSKLLRVYSQYDRLTQSEELSNSIQRDQNHSETSTSASSSNNDTI